MKNVLLLLEPGLALFPGLRVKSEENEYFTQANDFCRDFGMKPMAAVRKIWGGFHKACFSQLARYVKPQKQECPVEKKTRGCFCEDVFQVIYFTEREILHKAEFLC